MLLGIVVAIELIAPFLDCSVGVDAPALLFLMRHFIRLVSEGVLVPRWNELGFHGFGSPSFYFYPPLTFYVGTLVHAVTGISDMRQIFYLTSFVATLLSFFTARVFFRFLQATSYQSTIGALLYAFGPIRLVELYARGSLSSHVGFIFLPLVGCGAIMMVMHPERRIRGAVLFATAFALVALSSVPLTVVTMVSLLVVAVRYWRLFRPRILMHAVGAVVLATMLVAFHYTSSYSFSRSITTSIFNAAPHSGLFLQPMSGALLIVFYYLFSLDAAIVLMLLGWWHVRRDAVVFEPQERGAVQISTRIAILVLVLELPIPWLWKVLWPLQLSIDSERYFVVLLLCIAAFVAIAHTVSLRRYVVWITAMWVLMALPHAMLAAGNIHLFPHFEFGEDDPIEYTPSYATVWSVWDIIRDRSGTPSFEHEMGLAAIRVISSTPNDMQLRVSLDTAKRVTFRRYYWPAWHLFIHRKEVLQTPDSLGRPVTTLPAGNYQAEWKFERTPLEQAGLWTSSIAWGLVALGSIVHLIKRKRG